MTANDEKQIEIKIPMEETTVLKSEIQRIDFSWTNNKKTLNAHDRKEEENIEIE